MTLSFGSLFSGAGGFDIGMDRAGMRCAWQCEIDRTARSVLARHWPDVPRHEDVRGVGRHNLEPVDVVVGGFPCQDLSVAGKQAGLSGERSGLWWEMLRVVRELRPGLLVFENVPGLLSSDGGRDIVRVVSSLAEHDYFGLCRTLDAQHFGVPQRRRRVFGVFARGRAGVGRCAQILALAESLSGHPAAGREAGARPAFSLTASVGRSSEGNRVGNAWNTNYAVTGPLTAGLSRGPRGTEAVDCGFIINSAESCAKKSHARPSDVARCLDQTGGFASAQGGTVVAFAQNQRGEVRDLNDRATAVQQPATNQTTLLAFHPRQTPVSGEVAMPCETNGPMADTAIGRGVRRLTPRECERLMGWPDDWTRWRDDGTEIADGPRYRMCGNGVVGTVAEWLGRRIVAALDGGD